ncbi:MAG: DNA topoisomerase (ATP-hydrolyzing) subunit B [Candidatus Paceibacterota bacterium]|jgi:DNA gyrase subunit B|nr:DNA topoisomerase (ATP-hydrolyzing) subunit B [Candidatus Paceibacterota bacterium]MDD4875461.1 DNA topoisomerase (ATP-hydrolyzing) subunit B [Candidatus Paceibacterota bacterium]
MAEEKKQKKEKNAYRAKDIEILEGLEPVRKRPAMYIGSTGPEGLHHLIYEIVDNAIDEAIAGHCSQIDIALLPGERVQIKDNGRGIPVDIHPKTKKSALETVLTTLHAGAKFENKTYQVSGGLHGVGSSVVCALSTFMRAEVCRDGEKYMQEYKYGKPQAQVKKIEKCAKKETGTAIMFDADPQIFHEVKYNRNTLLSHFRQQAYLIKGIRINFSDLRDKDNPFEYRFYFEGGIASYLKYLTKNDEPIHSNFFYVSGEKNGILVETAFCYTDEYEVSENSFANNIYNPEGGTHLTGFRSALTRIINDYAKKEGFLKESETNLSGEDVREGLTAVVSIKIREPQFEGQTKMKLGNPEARTAVESVVNEAMAKFFEEYPQDAKTIVNKCVLSAKARRAAKAAKDTVLRKGILEGLSLPGKLADCSSRRPEESEIYLVEGDSAGGSSRQARDRRFQAILPLRGKILNVEKVRLDRALESKEIKSLVIAMGTAISDDFNIEKLRYHRIIIMTDADSDGNHIRTLLLTLFFRYFKSVIEKGYLYIAQPPLYKIQSGKEVKYAFDDEAKERILKEFKNRSCSVQRYKGLGEMNAPELWETTMDPKSRILLQVTIDDAQAADEVFDMLMGKQVPPRKKFIQLYAKKVKNLDI